MTHHVRDGAAGPARVGIVMGSENDLPIMAECCKVLETLGVAYEVNVMSAHRTPDVAAEWARGAAGRGLKVIVAGAGGAAHLAGAMAAHSLLPVIAVPLDATPLAGFDALLSSVQMPPGVPVACVAVGKMGATNAGFLAAQVLSLSDEALAARFAADRAARAQGIGARNAGLPAKLRDLLK
jgi:phosphoribosylamine--glycine ligase